MGQPSLREHISELNILPESAHAGLWLDRMLPKQLCEGERLGEHEQHPYTKLINQAHTIGEPKEYKQWFERWKAALNAHGVQQTMLIKQGEARVRGRMVVGLGAESVLENAVALHRTYGVPYIPGSVLKGLAAAYAHRFLADDTWRKERRERHGQPATSIGPAHKVMFGDTTSAGYVTFFDALYKPGSGHLSKALWPDVLTTHHPDYYQERKDQQGQLPPPADWDSPTPVSFISATGSYLIALAGLSPWVEAAFDILAVALDDLGVGAKTSSGYGRLTLEGLDAARERMGVQRCTPTGAPPAATPTDTPAATPARPNIPAGFVQSVKRSNHGSLPNLIGQWRALPEQTRAEAARIMIQHARDIKIKNLETKPWYQELQQHLSNSEGVGEVEHG